MVIDRGVFLYIEIPRRHVRLRLVVVVVRHEVLHRVFREEIPEFGVELRRERFIRRHHERRHPGARNDVRHREGLSIRRMKNERGMGK